MASQIPSLTVVYLTVNTSTDQRKHQSSASLAFVRGIHRGPVNFPHKGPVTRKMFPFDDVIMHKGPVIRKEFLCHDVIMLRCTLMFETFDISINIMLSLNKYWHITYNPWWIFNEILFQHVSHGSFEWKPVPTRCGLRAGPSVVNIKSVFVNKYIGKST